MNLRLIFCISLFTSILLTAQTIEIGRFFQDDNFSGSVTSAFIDLPTSPGNYTIEYTGLAGRGYSSHFFFDKGTYRSGYDGCYEIKINKLQIVPHDPEVGVPDDEYGDIREYVQSDPCSYHIDIRNSIVLNDYDLICIHFSCFPFFP